MAFDIYEFSMGCKPEYIPETREWVSGGFTNQFSGVTHNKIPELIVSAVNIGDESKGEFGIPDTFPPQPGQVALIARDLGEYCVLAVANLQKDNSSKPREFVGYRYFWLAKADLTKGQENYDPKIFDGIATLLWFWNNNNQPEFHVNSESHLTLNYLVRQPYTKQGFMQEHSGLIQDLLSTVVDDTNLFEAAQNGRELTPEEIHCLAIRANQVSNRPISWAWNIRRLDQRAYQNLLAIYCADNKALEFFHKNLVKQKPPRTTGVIPSTKPTGKVAPSSSLARVNSRNNDSSPGACLLSFRSKIDPAQVLNLLNYYQLYRQNIYEYRENDFLKYIYTEGSNPPDPRIRYATLLAVLAPNQTELVATLKKLSKQAKGVAIIFLKDLIEQAYPYRNHEAGELFLSCIFELYYILTEDFFPTNFNKYLPFFLKQRRWVFFILILSIILGSLVWRELPNVWQYRNRSHLNSPSNTTLSKDDELGKLLDNYKTMTAATAILTSEERKEHLQVMENYINELKKKIIQKLENDKGILEVLKDQDSNKVKDARQQPTYQALKKIIPQLDTKKLPKLMKGQDQETSDVKMLQIALIRAGYFSTPKQEVTGNFADKTEEAVIKAQNTYNKNKPPQSRIHENGVVEEKTWLIIQGRLEDEMVETVFNLLFTYLNRSEVEPNIFAKITQCRDDNQNEKALKFTACLKESSNY